MTNKPKVLFISAEVAPFAKVGGLADVAGALPSALANMGTDISVVMPLYGNVKKIFANKKLTVIECNGKKYKLQNVVKDFKVEFDGRNEKVNIYRGEIITPPYPPLIKGGSARRSKVCSLNTVPIYFVDNKKYFGSKDIYHPPIKFLFFSKIIAELIADAFRVDSCSDSRRFASNIIHCNDNHTAFIPVLLKHKGLNIKTVLTIHNLKFQGQFNPKKLKALRILLNSSKHLEADARDGDINKMAQGILSANAITTVSPTYAKEILTKEYGEGLDNILKMRKNDLYGIINGIDTEKFNPKTDRLIKYNYSVKNLEGKRKNKEALLREYFGRDGKGNFFNTPPYPPLLKGGSEQPPPCQGGKQGGFKKYPLIGLISRLASQKGIDLVIDAIPRMFKKHPNLLFILLGTGSSEYEKKLKELGEKYPNNFKPLIKFDLKIAQQIYAGSDMFLMPSKFEPCGLGQLTAMRYGTVPIVRKTGGLADTVVPASAVVATAAKEAGTRGFDHADLAGTGADLKADRPRMCGGANGFVFDEYSSKAMLKAIDEALEVYENKRVWKKLVVNGMRRDSSWRGSAREYLRVYKSVL